MEYTIYNESLVYYALRKDNGKYYGTFDCGDAHVGVVNTDTKLEDCIMYSSLKEAKNVQQFHKEYTQIRKVKVIDIGEVNDNI